jgi:hypothetical protein
MFDFLRRLFGRNRVDAPPPEVARQGGPHPSDDPEAQRIVDAIDRKWTNIRQRERAAEALADALLTPRERIKKRLNLPAEPPADYRPDASVPVLSPAYRIAAVPMIVVVNNAGIGPHMPRVLFEYLYHKCPLTANGRQVINDSLRQWGLEPEAL